MKRLLLLATAASFVFFSSCENEPRDGRDDERDSETEKEHDSSLEGTTWGRTAFLQGISDSGLVEICELGFSSTTVDFSCTYPYADQCNWGFAGTYTFYPPAITIKDTDGVEYKGIVENTGNETAIAITIRGYRFLLFLDLIEKEK
jgi:hypothetical protein